jgi:glucarate dehydratase
MPIGCIGDGLRTIVEVHTNEGITGLGEMGGGDGAAEASFAGLKPYLQGHDPFELEQLRWKIVNYPRLEVAGL